MMQFPETIELPEATLAIVRDLEHAGFETWCVGGALRDILLQRPHADFDIATAAPPERVRTLFRRTVPVGIEHGTVAVLDASGRAHEVTTFRRDVKTDGRHAVVEFGASLEEDLARRDFTINAIAYHPIEKRWSDPHGGRDDLERKIVRAVGRAEHRFAEDYLRILRAIRFSTRFGFAIEPATWSAALQHGDGLARLSAERVRDEWFKSLTFAVRPSEVANLWEAVGAVRLWFDGVDPLDQELVRALDRFPERDPILMTSWLVPHGPAVLERLKCSRAEIQRAAAVEEYAGSRPDAASAAAVRLWLSRVGPAADDLLTIFELASDDRMLRDSVRRVRAEGDPLTVGDLALSGGDLMREGVPEGPELGRMLRELLADVLADPDHNTKEYLLEQVRRRHD